MGLTQEVITASNFDDKIAKDISVVEFWADWNSANQFNEITKLKEASKYRVDIMHCTSLQTEYNITAIPTVVIFDNGVEKCWFNPKIMFQLDADKKRISSSVKELVSETNDLYRTYDYQKMRKESPNVMLDDLETIPRRILQEAAK